MFKLFEKQKTLLKSGILTGMTDWHSHILPGVDDGVQTMDEALEILRLYEQLGVKEVWLTPHIMEDIPNMTNSLRDRFKELGQTYNGTITLRLSAENMLDNLFAERLASNDVLPLGESGDRLLVETSYYTSPAQFLDILDEIMRHGYYPVLAHPERYLYMSHQDYEKLKKKGVYFQLNLASLLGFYGNPAKKQAEYLLEKGWLDLLGSDIHSLKMFRQQLFLKTGISIYERVKS